jgi:hypothetical protein
MTTEQTLPPLPEPEKWAEQEYFGEAPKWEGFFTDDQMRAYASEAVRNALERYPQPPTTDDEIGTLMHDIRNAVDLAGKGQWNAALEEVRNIKADLFRRKALAPQAPALTEEQREEILDEMVNTHGFSGGETEQMVGLVIDATIDALAADSPVAVVVQAQAPALTDEQESAAFETWISRDVGAFALKRWLDTTAYENTRVQDYRTGWFEAVKWLRAILAAASPTLPPLTDSMRAVLRNEKGTYQSEDELYAALVAASTQPKGETP